MAGRLPVAQHGRVVGRDRNPQSLDFRNGPPSPIHIPFDFLRLSILNRPAGSRTLMRFPVYPLLGRGGLLADAPLRAGLLELPFDAAGRERLDAAEMVRSRRVGEFSRCVQVSKSFVGPFQRRSSTDSKTGTSSRSVARVRNSSASFQELNNDSDKVRALRMDGSHSRQSLGMSSR
jgi:hypothetical protein